MARYVIMLNELYLSEHETQTQCWVMSGHRLRRWANISPALGQRRLGCGADCFSSNHDIKSNFNLTRGHLFGGIIHHKHIVVVLHVNNQHRLDKNKIKWELL